MFEPGGYSITVVAGTAAAVVAVAVVVAGVALTGSSDLKAVLRR
jgi:hypothetical protein